VHILLKGLWWPLETYVEAIDFAASNGIDSIGICYSSIDESSYLWRRPYKEETLGKIKNLSTMAAKRNLSIFVLLNPLVTSFDTFVSSYHKIRETFKCKASAFPPSPPLKFNNPEDVHLLLGKIDSLKGIGIDEIMICFDDAEAILNPIEEAKIANSINKRVKRTMLTPSGYCLSRADPEYLKRLGNALEKDIEVFWTGKDVVTWQVYKRDEEGITSMLGRIPSLWLNYPVNDYLEGELIQEPIPKSEIHLLDARSLLINPMFQFKESRAPILTLLDYLRQGKDYDPIKSWKKANQILS